MEKVIAVIFALTILSGCAHKNTVDTSLTTQPTVKTQAGPNPELSSGWTLIEKLEDGSGGYYFKDGSLFRNGDVAKLTWILDRYGYTHFSSNINLSEVNCATLEFKTLKTAFYQGSISNIIRQKNDASYYVKFGKTYSPNHASTEYIIWEFVCNKKITADLIKKRDVLEAETAAKEAEERRILAEKKRKEEEEARAKWWASLTPEQRQQELINERQNQLQALCSGAWGCPNVNARSSSYQNCMGTGYFVCY